MRSKLSRSYASTATAVTASRCGAANHNARQLSPRCAGAGWIHAGVDMCVESISTGCSYCSLLLSPTPACVELHSILHPKSHRMPDQQSPCHRCVRANPDEMAPYHSGTPISAGPCLGSPIACETTQLRDTWRSDHRGALYYRSHRQQALLPSFGSEVGGPGPSFPCPLWIFQHWLPEGL